MEELEKAREEIKKAIAGDTEKEEVKEAETAVLAQEENEEEKEETENEVEAKNKKQNKKQSKKQDKEEEESKELHNNEEEEVVEDDEKEKKQVDNLKEKIQAKDNVINTIQAQLDDAMEVINNYLESVIPKLSKEDQKLIEDISDNPSPVARYRALTTLQKHSKVSTSKKNAPRVSVDQTRVARAEEIKAKPQSFNDARKAIKEQFLKLAK